MARRKQLPKDLTGIRQRGATYQVRVSAGYDPVTDRQLTLSGSADTEDAAIVIRDQLRQQVRDNTAARTNVTLGYLLDEWLSGHQVEDDPGQLPAADQRLHPPYARPTPLVQLCKQSPRPFEQLYAQLRVRRRRCHGRRLPSTAHLDRTTAPSAKEAAKIANAAWGQAAN
jgi:integrase